MLATPLVATKFSINRSLFKILFIACFSSLAGLAQEMPAFETGEPLRAQDLNAMSQEITRLRGELAKLSELVEVAQQASPSGQIVVPPLDQRAQKVGSIFVSMDAARYNNEKLVVDIIVRSTKDQTVTFQSAVVHDSNGNSWRLLKGRLLAGNRWEQYKSYVEHTLIEGIDTRIRYTYEKVKSRPEFIARIDLPFVIEGTSEKILVKNVPVEGS